MTPFRHTLVTASLPTLEAVLVHFLRHQAKLDAEWAVANS